MRKEKKKLGSVLVAIGLGIFVGLITQKGRFLAGMELFEYVHPLYVLGGDLFIHSLTLVVVPLVASSIITGVARVGEESEFGRLGVRVFAFYIGTTFLAVIIGLLFVNLFRPGEGVSLESMKSGAAVSVTAPGGSHISNLILSIIPANIVDAFGKAQMLGIIFFSVIFGYSLSKLKSKHGETLMSVCQGLFDVMLRITHLIMKALPLGVFLLVAKIFSESGMASLTSLGVFSITVLCALLTFMFVGLPLVLKYVGKVDPVRHFKAMAPALITAFSTSSSAAALPITIECVEKRAKVSNRICSLVVPLGTSVNMAGSALYECVAALFVAQAYGLDLSLTTQFITIFLALVMSMGVAGVPSGSLVAIIIILKTMGLPLEGIGLFVAVERLLDMCRTTVNVFSDTCCAVCVAKAEGERNVLATDL